MIGKGSKSRADSVKLGVVNLDIAHLYHAVCVHCQKRIERLVSSIRNTMAPDKDLFRSLPLGSRFAKWRHIIT